MKSRLGSISINLFIVGLISSIMSIVFVVGKLLLIGAIASGAGLVLALFSENKKGPLISNGLLFFLIMILPFLIRTLFWNRP
ncbi:hypothetical protein [Halalkalibacter sp. APA_J-10(15)]|uniref:hypothetical protein n=1 Tax=Halalkalibacter sp. APA_J-10(15) TaxID=2933805 RepID=UPI001FF59ABF|nr:hypothetical protein [Halalkalibacter sp. APA_J-10(15)]MCK0470542.1 hypothetical protein [Halalkalibacter sp. APA_J-10(15)]